MSKIVILQYSQDFSSTKKKKKFNEKLISRVWKQSVTRLPDSREAILVDRKRKKKKWELFQTRKRWRRHDLLSILRDTIYPTIYSYNGKKSGLRLMFSPPHSRFHCCALLVPGTISYLEIRTCNYFKEHHSFRVMCMA